MAFVLAPTDQGTLIVNRFDYKSQADGLDIGVGDTLFSDATHDVDEIGWSKLLLGLRRRYFGDGVVVVACGANIGVFTVEWAKSMTGWGSVLAIEAQERIFYALAGNIAIGNCFNAQAVHAAAGAAPGMIDIPHPNYLAPVSMISLDSLSLARLDLLKIDVEGMEMDVNRMAIVCSTRA